jgi:hypothetical protein
VELHSIQLQATQHTQHSHNRSNAESQAGSGNSSHTAAGRSMHSRCSTHEVQLPNTCLTTPSPTDALCSQWP